MRRYISNKGLRITFQRDITQHLPGSDGAIMAVTKQPLIELVFQKLIGGDYGFSPYDLGAGLNAFAKVVGTAHTYANIHERNGARIDIDAAPIMVPIHGIESGAPQIGRVTNDGVVMGDEQKMDPAARLWVFDVDRFCETNPLAEGLEEAIEAFLDSEVSGRDHVKVVAPRSALPFPGYDKQTKATRIAQLVSELEIDPHTVIAYEHANARDLSAEIVEAMEARLAKNAELEASAEQERIDQLVNA